MAMRSTDVARAILLVRALQAATTQQPPNWLKLEPELKHSQLLTTEAGLYKDMRETTKSVGKYVSMKNVLEGYQVQ